MASSNTSDWIKDWTTTTLDPSWITTTSTWGNPWIIYPSSPPIISLEDDSGHPCIVFRDKDNKVIARLWLDKDNPTFMGGRDKATKLFMESIKQSADQYIRQQRDNMITNLEKEINTASKSIEFFNRERAGAMNSIVDVINIFLAGLRLAA